MAEDMRVLGQRLRTSLLLAQQTCSPYLPSPTKMMWRVPDSSAFMLQLRIHELRKPLDDAVITTAWPLFLQGTLINYIWQYATLPSDPKGRLSLSSKAIGYPCILGKIVQNKKTNRTCRNIIDPRKIISWQKHRGAILNSLSTGQSSIPKESPDQIFGILSVVPAQLFFHV